MNKETSKVGSDLGKEDKSVAFDEFVQWLSGAPYRIILFIILALAAVIGTAYISWWHWLGPVISWANDAGWRWIFTWFAVMFLAILPVYVGMGSGYVLTSAMNAKGERAEKKQLDELDLVEMEIRGSDDPIDYAKYSRKALRAYYLMGQNQVRLSFYVGVLAMIFGFIFLVSGLLAQAFDPKVLPYLRSNLNLSPIAVGGGLIIEFIAATFLWIYRTAILQLNVYYRRQTLIHSALLSVAIAKDLEGDNLNDAIKNIISTVLTPSSEIKLPELPKTKSQTDKHSG